MHLLTRLSLINRWITFVLAVALVGVSVWATLRIKQEMIPDIEFPHDHGNDRVSRGFARNGDGGGHSAG